jgi:allophanate hydrolase
MADLTRLALDAQSLHLAYQSGGLDPGEVVREVYRRIGSRGDDGVWLSLVPQQQAEASARALGPRRPELPLYGLPFGVKDNVDVAGLPTTCGCAAITRVPERHATAVQRALDAGAIVIGKQNLDQFATGLNGTRTLGTFPRNAINPDYVPGGSSSGSAVAVAAGLVTFSLGSDTGGSGRVPAAMNGIVGLKPSFGLISASGMVFNNRLFDCLPIFARNVDDVTRVLLALRGADPADPFSRDDVSPIVQALPSALRWAVPLSEQLQFFGDAAQEAAYQATVSCLAQAFGPPSRLDCALYFEAGRLPFESALLAERALTYAPVVRAHRSSVHPAVAALIDRGSRFSAEEAFEAVYRMQELRRAARRLFGAADVLVLPTVGRAWRCEEMLRDPITLNNLNGYYTYPVNPLDLAALALPGMRRADHLPFGVQLVAPAGADGLLLSLGQEIERMTQSAR